MKTYYGTGIEAAAYGTGLFIFAVVPGSPAARAGLLPNDRIASLNGQKLNNLRLAHNAIFKLRPSPGERLNLEIEREGELYHSELSVAPVVMPVDPSRILKAGGRSYLHLRLRAFRRGICAQVENRVREAGAIDGLILDLRHNRGGLVEEAECLVRLFADEPKVVSRQALRLEFPPELNFERNLPDHSKNSVRRSAFGEVKLIVLMDGQSASASELTAGALQDFHRAWIVGERSFGKGITQLYVKVDGYPKLELLKTVSRYLRPSGLGVHGQGIRPNFEIPFRADFGFDARRVIREENSGSYFKLPSEKWSEDRGEIAQKIRSCAAAADRGRNTESSVKAQLGYPDHQLSGAISLLGCF
jgi:carboxyl-terminal processing protease